MKLEGLVEYIEQEGGIATAAQLKESGYLPGLIDYAYRTGRIDKLTRGVYCSVDVFDDEFAAISVRWKKCVFSHASALYLLGMSDRVPSVLDVTVPRGYNPKALKESFPDLHMHWVTAGLYAVGITEVKTPFGMRVRAYDAERSVADLIRQRTKEGVDAQLMKDAIRGYFSYEEKNIDKLTNICKMLQVQDELRVYLEVFT